MNCRDSESLILAERDGTLTNEQRAALSDHVAACPTCAQLRTSLRTALAAYKADVATIPVPDADEAWREVQSRLHKPARKRPLAPVIWFTAPLAAAAAIALAFFAGRSPQASDLPPSGSFETARADYVEAGDANASTMVFVDKDSGWLVVWATDGDANGNG